MIWVIIADLTLHNQTLPFDFIIFSHGTDYGWPWDAHASQNQLEETAIKKMDGKMDGINSYFIFCQRCGLFPDIESGWFDIEGQL